MTNKLLKTFILQFFCKTLTQLNKQDIINVIYNKETKILAEKKQFLLWAKAKKVTVPKTRDIQIKFTV